MAYEVPPRPVHGQIVISDDFQKYSDSLNALHDTLGDKLVNLPVAVGGGEELMYIRHQYRWLVYDDNGAIQDPTAVGDDVTLSDPGGIAYYDLNTVEWLAYGQIYALADLDWVVEVEQRVIVE